MKKRWIILLGLLAAAFAFAATGLADPGHGKGHGKHGTFGPYNVVTDDHGSCGTPWAVDTEKRTFSVHRNPDGSYTVLRRDRGTFLTNAGQSPGACETKGRHGATVLAGVHGKFHGYLVGRVTGTFNPNATCTAPNCGFTDVWINAFFGPGAAATFTCNINSKACRFDFEYTAARHQHLKYRHWFDKGTGAGTLLNERFRGDIANA